MTASATHDTKRGEDARARLLALSEAPDLWRAMLAVWKDEAGTLAQPDANDQYMLLQTIVGVWPVELLETGDAKVLAALHERLFAYIPKALREAKRHSKWIEPNEAYETATKDLVTRLLAEGSRFIERMRPLLRDIAQRGMLISLARTVLKCTVPGVPDFYQGTALWDFSLVDPDNRRPVDYTERAGLLAAAPSIATLLGTWQDGVIKLAVIGKLLADRQAHRAFYANADYVPVEHHRAENVLAFTRGFKGEALVVVVPRLSGKDQSGTRLPLGVAAWGTATLTLPGGTWRNVFDASEIEGGRDVALAQLFETLPFAVLRMVE